MKTLRLVAVLASITSIMLLGACATIDAGGTIKEKPAALHGDYSGKDFSGGFAMVPDACDIPGVPASSCKTSRPRLAPIDIEQVLRIDGHCQEWLFKQLPGWAQAIAKESGWGALATAVGEAGFAAAFPGADMARYFLAGLGYGLPSWANNGRVRQDQGEKGSAGYCATLKIFRAQQRYQILTGWDAIPWSGPGHTTLPAATDNNQAPTPPYINGRMPPVFGR